MCHSPGVSGREHTHADTIPAQHSSQNRHCCLSSLDLRIGSANTILHSVSIVTMGMGAMGGWAGASQRHRHREMPIGHLQQQRVSLELQSRSPRPTPRPILPAWPCHGNAAHDCVFFQARITIFMCMRPSIMEMQPPARRKSDSPRVRPIPRGVIGDLCVCEAAALPRGRRCNESAKLL